MLGGQIPLLNRIASLVFPPFSSPPCPSLSISIYTCHFLSRDVPPSRSLSINHLPSILHSVVPHNMLFEAVLFNIQS